jgi:hypothetical protein
MKGNMPEATTDDAKTPPARIQLSPEAAKAVSRFITETDWNAFWDRVIERTAPEIDAYEKARVKSLGSAPHVFQ